MRPGYAKLSQTSVGARDIPSTYWTVISDFQNFEEKKIDKLSSFFNFSKTNMVFGRKKNRIYVIEHNQMNKFEKFQRDISTMCDLRLYCISFFCIPVKYTIECAYISNAYLNMFHTSHYKMIIKHRISDLKLHLIDTFVVDI